eukprot:4216475-Amphidinium_carterae.2
MTGRLSGKQAAAMPAAAKATGKAKPAAKAPVPPAPHAPASVEHAPPSPPSTEPTPPVKNEIEVPSQGVPANKTGRPGSNLDKADMSAWCRFKKTAKGKVDLAGKSEKAIQDYRSKWCLDRQQSRVTATESKQQELQDEHTNETGWFTSAQVAEMEHMSQDSPAFLEFLAGLPRQPNDRYAHVRHLRQFDVYQYNGANKNIKRDIKRSTLTSERSADIDNDTYDALGEDIGVGAEFAVNVSLENKGPRVIGMAASSSQGLPPACSSPLQPSTPAQESKDPVEEPPRPMAVLLKLEKRGQGLVREGRNLLAEVPLIRLEKAHLGGLCDVYEVGFKKLQKEMDELSVFLGSPQAIADEAKLAQWIEHLEKMFVAFSSGHYKELKQLNAKKKAKASG